VCTWNVTSEQSGVTTSRFPTPAVPEHAREREYGSLDVEAVETDNGEYRLVLTDSRTGNPIRELEHTPPSNSGSYDLNRQLSEDGKRIALFNKEDDSDDSRFRGAVTVWDTGSGKLIDFFPPGTELKAAAEGNNKYPFIAVVDDTEIRVVGSIDRKLYGYFPRSAVRNQQALLSETLVPEPAITEPPETDNAQQLRRACILKYFDTQSNKRHDFKKRSETFASKSPPKRRRELSLDDI
jgi:hypothetical protein